MCRVRLILLLVLAPCISCDSVEAEKLATEQLLTIQRIHPASPTIEVPPNEAVDVECLITNNSERVMHNLAPRLACKCQVVGELPTLLEPGAQAKIVFRVRAPQGGLLEERIEISEKPNGDPLGAIQIPIKAVADPPYFVRSPGSVRLVVGHGKSSSIAFCFETIERTEAVRWVQSVEAIPSDLIVCGKPEVIDHAFGISGLTRRLYRYDLRCNKVVPGRASGVLRVTMGSGDVMEVYETSLEVVVRDRFQIVPSKIVARVGESSVFRVRVLDSEGGGKIRVGDFHANAIRTRRIEVSHSGIVTMFEVAITADEPMKAEIPFKADGVTIGSLPIEIN